jgi:nucleoside-diphosphate-sugar epimerase
MRIIVAGGSGFIGSHLCEYLLNQGHHVICLDNLLTGRKENLKTAEKHKQFKFIKADISQPLPTKLGKVEAIFHLASPASPNINSPISYHHLGLETMLANTQGTLNLLRLAKLHKARFVYASSSEIYGDPKVNPQPESYHGNVSTTGPRSVYDEAKRFGETLTAFYTRKYQLDTRIARIFNTYGPRICAQDQRMLTNFILQAINNQPITLYGNGKQTRSLCYISDMVEGLAKLMFTSNLKGKIFNLGNPKELSVIKYAQIVKKLTKSSSPIVQSSSLPKDDPLLRQPDITKAKKILHWQPTIELEEGVNQTITYYQNE